MGKEEKTTMIYLIGGPPRVGKSTLAQKFTKEKNIPFISTDMLLWMLIDTIPELNLWKPYTEVPKKFFPFLKNFVKHTVATVPDYVIEGDAFYPEQVAELQKEFQVRACFLGTSHISLETIKKHVGHNDWLDEISEQEKTDLPGWIMEVSGTIQAECKKFSLPYFDTASNFEEAINRAFQSLLEI